MLVRDYSTRDDPLATPHTRTGRTTSVAEIGSEVANWLWRLGPAFVKLGQVLSSRPDLIDPRICYQLKCSLALGHGRQPRRHVYPTFIASGSVADVYRVQGEHGDLAIKVLRQGVAASLARDLALVEGLATASARFAPRRLPVRPLVHDLCESVRQQADLSEERRRLVALASLETTCDVVLPRPIEDLSTPDQLAMSWLPNQGEIDPMERATWVARELLRVVFEMLFVTGTVHCDLHPGNWWIMPDGRIAIVDAGFAFQLDAEMQEHFTQFFFGMATGDAELCSTHAIAAALGPVTESAQRSFRAQMVGLIEGAHGRPTSEFSLARFAYDFFAIQRANNAISRPSFIFPIVALLAIEGQVKALDASVDFQAVAMPAMMRWLVSHPESARS